MAEITPSENTVYTNIRTVLAAARQKAYSAVNSAMVEQNRTKGVSSAKRTPDWCFV